MCDLYNVIAVNGNLVDIQECIVDTDKLGNINKPIVRKNISVYSLNSNGDRIDIEIKVGSIGVFFYTKRNIQNFLKTGNIVDNLYSQNNGNSGFFMPINGNISGTGLLFKSDTKIQILVGSSNVVIQNGTINITSTSTHDGDITINGNVTVNSGNVQVNGGDVLADLISLKNHKHNYIDTLPNGLPSDKTTTPSVV